MSSARSGWQASAVQRSNAIRKTAIPASAARLAVGGKLHGFWYAFGDADGYVLAEFPSDVVAASTLTKVAPSCAFGSVSTTKLLTWRRC
jgi:GYD domain